MTYAIAEFFGSGIVLFAGCMGCAFHHADFVVEKAFSFGLAFVVSLQVIIQLNFFVFVFNQHDFSVLVQYPVDILILF